MGLLTCEDIIAAIPDVYQKGYNDGLPPVQSKYTFPPNIPYNDVMELVGSDPVTDEDLSITIKTELLSPSGASVAHAFWVDSNGDEHNIFREASGSKTYLDCRAKVTDTTTGDVEVVYTWYYTDYGESTKRATTRTVTVNDLIGYGASGHTFSVENKG